MDRLPFCLANVLDDVADRLIPPKGYAITYDSRFGLLFIRPAEKAHTFIVGMVEPDGQGRWLANGPNGPRIGTGRGEPAKDVHPVKLNRVATVVSLLGAAPIVRQGTRYLVKLEPKSDPGGGLSEVKKG